MADRNTTVGIIGAGITGLATAFILREKHIDVTVYEKSSTPGGVIRTIHRDGWRVELGPNTIMARKPKVWELLNAVDLSDRVIFANERSKNRYIVKNGRPRALPLSLMDFITTGLFSWSSKLGLFREPFIKPVGDDDESVAGFFERRFGREAVQYAVDPFVAGIYAGKADRLSMKHTFPSIFSMEQRYGSVIRGAVKRKSNKGEKLSAPSQKKGLINFDRGLQTLPEALSDQLGQAVHFDAPVSAIDRQQHKWILEIENQAAQPEHDALILTLPAHRMQKLNAPPNLEESFERLSGIPYVPVSVVATGFKRSQVRHPLDGFGMLVPSVEPYNILGTLFSSTLFPGRAPDDHVLLTTFAGGGRQPDLAQQPDNKLYEVVLEDLRELLGIRGEPVYSLRHNWETAIPQYNLGYDSFINVMENIDRDNPGLYLAGNFRGGVSLPDRIEQAYETAKKVELFLRS